MEGIVRQYETLCLVIWIYRLVRNDNIAGSSFRKSCISGKSSLEKTKLDTNVPLNELLLKNAVVGLSNVQVRS